MVGRGDDVCHGFCRQRSIYLRRHDRRWLLHCRYHTHHLLLDLGLTHFQSTLFILGLNLLIVVFVIIFRHMGNVQLLLIIIPLLIAVAYFTIAERKIMGIIQRRKGPNVIGFVGLFQPLADGLKLFVKEVPATVNVTSRYEVF